MCKAAVRICQHGRYEGAEARRHRPVDTAAAEDVRPSKRAIHGHSK